MNVFKVVIEMDVHENRSGYVQRVHTVTGLPFVPFHRLHLYGKQFGDEFIIRNMGTVREPEFVWDVQHKLFRVNLDQHYDYKDDALGTVDDLIEAGWVLGSYSAAREEVARPMGVPHAAEP